MPKIYPLVKYVGQSHDIYFLCREQASDLLNESVTNITHNQAKTRELLAKVKQMVSLAGKGKNITPTLCRVNLSGNDGSVMEYNNIVIPHPELRKSLKFNFEGDLIKQGNLKTFGTINPPILHRVENYFYPNTPNYLKHQAITEKEEQVGIFTKENLTKIGFKLKMIEIGKKLGYNYPENF